MAKIWCCRRFQDAEVFKITPTRNNILEEFVLYRHSCSFCQKPVLEILRMDINEDILKPVRLNPKNISLFTEKMEVLKNLNKKFIPKNKISKFVLKYNEFGKTKNCSANLVNLWLGKIETDPVINLKTYKNCNNRCFS